MKVPFDKPIVCPVLIGRTSYLEALAHSLERLKSGSGHTVLVSGEAGVGKSCLTKEAKALALQQDIASLQGNCFEQDRSLPYAPFLDLLGTFLATHSPEDITGFIGSSGPELLKVLPDLSTRLPDVSPTPALEPEQEKRRLFHALAHLFIHLSTLYPLLLVIEDVQWSDATSLEFLLYLARRIGPHPILLLLTYRSDEAQSGLAYFLAGLDRERLATEWPLGRLSKGEVETMLRAVFELQRPVRADFLNAMYALTEGNPFFIEEVLRSLVAGGEIFYADGEWDRKSVHELNIPRSVQAAVQRRLEQVSAAAQAILNLAAVAGHRFDFSLLQHLTGRDEDELLQLMKELMAAQLVVEESEERFAFRHALTRQAIYGNLLVRERKKLHGRIAEKMAWLYAGAVETRLGDLGYHFYQAEDWSNALEYAQRAGERAQALYAPQAAIDHFTHALEAARRLPGVTPQPLLRARGQAYELLGDFEQAKADYEAALHLTGIFTHRQAEWQTLLDLGLLWAGRDYTQTGVYYQRAFELASEMGELATIAHSLNRMGNWQLNIEQPAEARQRHEEALAIFQRLGDQEGLAETLDLLGMTNIMGGDLVQGTACYEQVVALFRQRDDRQMLASSLVSLLLCKATTYQTDTVVLAQTGVAGAADPGEEGLKIASEIGWRSGEVYALIVLGFCLGPQGEYTRALALAQTGLRIAEEIAHRQWLAAAHCVVGALYREMLALPEAQRHLEQALALAQESGSLHWVRCATGQLASTSILQQNLDQAAALLDATLPPEAPMQTLGQRLAWCVRGELALARGDGNQALDIADRLIDSAVNREQRGRSSVPRLAQLRGEALAALAALAGNGSAELQQEAAVTLRAAREGALAQGLRPLLWRIHVTLGNLYRVQARLEEAEHAYGAARSIVEELAAGLDDSLRDTFLQRATALIPLSPPASAPPSTQPVSPRRSAREAPGGLTTREREVAILIAQGKTNREIADILVVGERTVETHVSNILSKLYFTSRAQIAVWAVEKGVTKNEG